MPLCTYKFNTRWLFLNDMTSELVATIAILSAIAGTTFVTVKQWWASTTPLNWESLVKSIVIASFATVTTLNLTNIPDPTTGATTWLGLIITYLLIGSGTQLALGHKQQTTK